MEPPQDPAPPQPQPQPSRPPRWLRVLLVLAPALLLVIYFTIPMGAFGPDHPQLSWTVFGIALAVLALLLVVQIRTIVLSLGRGMPAVAILVLFSLALVLFAAAYLALARSPSEFDGLHTRIDALYFTVVTMSTVGYGDIVPTGQSARVVVMVQILYTFVFLTAGATALGQQLRGRLGRRLRVRHPDGPPRPPGADPSARG
ncbi:hypothetical protein GCM10009665_57600 [Kitasatospora nipponensis]|uniref:Potassium channel domain-containing protein n=1 Tax=Kitasatospora nipponensis TaxID=258049 RepID=A0ABN1WQI9_9ACTN